MLRYQCFVVFWLGFLIDLLQTLHIQACSERGLFMAVATIVAIYSVGFFGHDWFVEQKSRMARLWITLAGALGAGLGTAVVIFWGW